MVKILLDQSKLFVSLNVKFRLNLLFFVLINRILYFHKDACVSPADNDGNTPMHCALGGSRSQPLVLDKYISTIHQHFIVCTYIYDVKNV